MDLRITIALLFILITGGHSLKCYSCTPSLNGVCDAKEETCGDGLSKCSTTTLGSVITKSCSKPDGCGTETVNTELVKSSVQCCDTDLCNGADGVFKGSFLLLLCPLFFYTLCH